MVVCIQASPRKGIGRVNPLISVRGFCVQMIYFTREDIKLKIDENRDLKDLIDTRIEELTMWFHSLEGKEDCVVDLKGRILGKKQKKTSYYSIIKAREERKEEHRKRLWKMRGVKLPWEG